MGPFDEAASRLVGADAAAAVAAAERHARLTKPPGSLGRLESLGARLAAMAGTSPPPVPEPATVAVFAADHGVLAEGVSPWPAEVTTQMVANLCAGGAAVSVLARHAGARVVVVDVGVAGPELEAGGLRHARIRAGSANLAEGPAMTLDEARRALDVGSQVAAEETAQGARCLVTGDMGIANTTPSAALICALTGVPARQVTGRGTGIDDAMWQTKVSVVERALNRPKASSALELLASVGGLEIAALAGFVVGGAAARVPVIVDGVIACAAALAAARMVPGCADYCVAGHRSSEPGASVALGALGLDPVLDLEMRLGEGTGACLALPIVQAAAKVLREMATFGSAGVSERPQEPAL